MWLGMLVAGRRPGARASRSRRSTRSTRPLLAYVAQVAAWCARPSWASLEVRLGPGGLLASYAGDRARGRCSSGCLGCGGGSPRSPAAELRLPAAAAAVGGGLAALVARLRWAALGLGGGEASAAAPPAGLRVTVLDVGQGDAILLQPAGAPAVLVDGGPPGRRARRRSCDDAGVERARRRGRHPRPVRPRRRRSRSCSASAGRAAPLRGRRPAPARGGARAPGRDRSRVAAGPRAALGPAAPRGRLAAAGAARRGRRPARTRTGWRWSIARPLGPASRCCSPPTPRPRRRRSTRARSTSSRSPTTAARTPASTALLDRTAAEAGGDLGRRRTTPTGTRPRRRSRPSPRTACASCAPTATERVVIDVRHGRRGGSRRKVERVGRTVEGIFGFPGYRPLASRAARVDCRNDAFQARSDPSPRRSKHGGRRHPGEAAQRIDRDARPGRGGRPGARRDRLEPGMAPVRRQPVSAASDRAHRRGPGRRRGGPPGRRARRARAGRQAPPARWRARRDGPGSDVRSTSGAAGRCRRPG